MNSSHSSGESLRRRAFQLLRESRALPLEHRSAWLADRLQAHPEIESEVTELLAIEQRSLPLLDRPSEDETSAGDLRIGTSVGRFRIEARIAVGGMGAVYRAMPDWQGAQAVALKLIRRGMESEGIVQRFLRERALLAGLRHRNIAQLLDAGISHDGQPWFAMELIEGESIEKYVAARALPLPDRIDLVQQVIAAVAAAHQRLVVHRDIKSANVLVTPDGTVKLLDFGVAKSLDDSDMRGGETLPGDHALTPLSAAPEQLRGERTGTAVDIFQLGLLLFHVLLGAPSSRTTDGGTETLTAGFRRVGTHSTLPLTERALRGDLERIVAKATHAEAERRYPTAPAFGEDLQRWRDGRPVQAMPDSLRYRARKWISRYRRPVFAAAVVLVLILAASALAIERSIEARRETALAQASEREARVAEAKAEASRKSAEATRQLIIDALVAVDPNSGLGANPTRAQMLASASHHAEERLKDDPAALVDVLTTIASADVTLDERAAAEALFKRIVALSKDRPALRAYRGIALARLAYFGHLRGDGDTQRQLDEGLDLLRHEGRSTAPFLAEALRIKTSELYDAGDMKALPALLQEATDAAAQGAGENSFEFVTALNQQAILLHLSGHSEEALSIARRAVSIDANLTRAGEQVRLSTLTARGNLARILSETGNAREALPMIRSTLELSTQLLGAEHPNIGFLHYEQAGIERDLGLFEDAEKHYRLALAVKAGTLDAGARAAIAGGIASAQIELGENAQAALAQARAICPLRGNDSPACLRVRFLDARVQAMHASLAATPRVSADDTAPPLASLITLLFGTDPVSGQRAAIDQAIAAMQTANIDLIAYARLRVALTALAAHDDVAADTELAAAKSLLDAHWDGHPPLRQRIDACVLDHAHCLPLR